MSDRTRLFFCLLLMLLSFSCVPAYKQHIPEYIFQTRSESPDYANLQYWAANPAKKNLSDSVPAPLRQAMVKDSMVDVFFIHPTTSKSDDTSWNADINDPDINAKTDYSTILYQASVFNECRVFAPRYRQAAFRAYFTKDKAEASRAFDLAYADIRIAFQYYLDHYNQGRPIIIAAHSQGTTHAERLLKEFFDGKPLQPKLVAAYLLGMAIPKDFFSVLKPCADSTQTGCFIGWRTYKIGYEPAFIKLENGDSYVINPLLWTSSKEYAPRFLNRGAVLKNFNKIRTHIADAQIHDDILWIHKPHFPGSIFYRSKSYHIADINLFYINIRDNVRTRIRAFK